MSSGIDETTHLRERVKKILSELLEKNGLIPEIHSPVET